MKRYAVVSSDSELSDETTTQHSDKKINTYRKTGPTFQPHVFLRCHSSLKEDSADVQTQVWYCAFEPNCTSDLVATCGGNSICFIDVRTAVVKWKYYAEDPRELFYTLSWSCIVSEPIRNKKTGIVAAGGARGVIHLLHPQNGVVFYTHRLKCPSKIVISALLFHEIQPQILFGSKSDGSVLVWNIGFPVPPKYSVKFTVLHQLLSRNEIFSLAYCLDTSALLAASADGICVWLGDIEDKSLQQITLKMPPMPGSMNVDSPQLVDSIEVLRGGKIAAKCALHGAIYILNLKDVLKNCKHNTSLKITPTHILKWSNTDNYFMNMGFSEGLGVLACGDDEGSLWLYDTKTLFSEDVQEGSSKVNPFCILQWPDITDNNYVKKFKLNPNLHDIVVDKVAINYAGDQIVAVTSNNLVCIWKRLD